MKGSNREKSNRELVSYRFSHEFSHPNMIYYVGTQTTTIYQGKSTGDYSYIRFIQENNSYIRYYVWNIIYIMCGNGGNVHLSALWEFLMDHLTKECQHRTNCSMPLNRKDKKVR